MHFPEFYLAQVAGRRSFQGQFDQTYMNAKPARSKKGQHKKSGKTKLTTLLGLHEPEKPHSQQHAHMRAKGGEGPRVGGGAADREPEGGRDRGDQEPVAGSDDDDDDDSQGSRRRLQSAASGPSLPSRASAGQTVTRPEPRAAVFLVETSNEKKPKPESLGGTERVSICMHSTSMLSCVVTYNVHTCFSIHITYIPLCVSMCFPLMRCQILDKASPENGHVPRNARLGLMAVDAVQPYACFAGIALNKTSETSGTAGTAPPPPPPSRLSLQWYAGGGFSVGKDSLRYS